MVFSSTLLALMVWATNGIAGNLHCRNGYPILHGQRGPTVNHWPNDKWAKAFWSQHHNQAYRVLLRDTDAWLEPRSGQRWIDLGCGGGQLTRSLWEKSAGTLAQIIALDIAPANELAIAKLRASVSPKAGPDQIRFVRSDFSGGLAGIADASLDGAVSGLSLQYAEHWDPEKKHWTDAAYDQILREIYRVLRPGGTLVFSVNVPDPSWWRVALTGISSFFTSQKPIEYLKDCSRMMRYGDWLKGEARRGRFHFLPWARLSAKLKAAGFDVVDHRTSYAGQAFVVRCRKPE